ncbi:autophagy-related protein 16-1 [Plakobranchus ocellatus]|uniref:Autophagy-related protein 16-1 n=1 Tax=Plakobranchus ocellatus TaxID=259542 RepID=A0AAV4CAP2_9GAST|nr:autophagy-related protein 16-1 [Plakobranchus ocellatus]
MLCYCTDDQCYYDHALENALVLLALFCGSVLWISLVFWLYNASSANTHALEQKLYRLQEELTEMHKKKGENSQQIIDLTTLVQEKEKELQQKDSMISDMLGKNMALKQAKRNLELSLTELEATNQMLKDEHQALQMAFSALEEKYRKCQDDNNDLVQRWMEQKAKDADRMNAENADFIKDRQQKLARDLAEAAKEQILLDQGKAPLEGLTPVTSVVASIPNRAQHSFDAHDGEVYSVQWNSSGRLFATGGADRKIKLWEYHNSSCDLRGALVGSNAGITSLDYSQDMAFSALEEKYRKCQDDNNDLVQRWMEQKAKDADRMNAENADFIKDRQQKLARDLAEAAKEQILLDQGKAPLEGLTPVISVVASIPNRAQHSFHTLTGHSGKVLTAKFLSENRVVSGSHDRTLKVWDLHSKSCMRTIFAGSSCNDLVTLQGTTIISGHFDKRVRFWDVRGADSSTNEILLQGRLTSLCLAPDKTQLLCCTRDDCLKIIDLRMNQVACTLVADGFKVGCDWSRAVFSPDLEYAAAGSSDGNVYVWNIAKTRVEKVLKNHSHAVLACSWSPMGSSIVSCEKGRKVVVWSDY